MSKKPVHPPYLAKKLLSFMRHYSEEYSCGGDLVEEYRGIAKERGKCVAYLWYWWQVLYAIPTYILLQIEFGGTMFKNYFKIALRNMKKNKSFSFINIAGFAAGIAAFILIMLYVQYELSFDNYHKNVERIFRVVAEFPGESNRDATTPAPLAEALRDEFPEIVSAAKMRDLNNLVIACGEKNFRERQLFFIEPEVFDIFSIPSIKGDLKTAMTDPFSIILSERMAEKYFGEEEPIGKILTLRERYNYKVAGIIENMPGNSHFVIDLAIPFINFSRFSGVGQRWGSNFVHTYLLMREGISPEDLERKFPRLLDKYMYQNSETEESMKHKYFLQPVKSIHLHSHYNGEINVNNDIKYIYLFSSVAFLILVIACINYMNLSTARSIQRSREVGIRKVVGAMKGQLIKQFIGESLLFTFIAVVVSVTIVILVLPVFNGFLERDLTFNLVKNPWLILLIVSIILFAGLFSGSYPALYISSLKPAGILKSTVSRGSSGVLLRKILVTTQFIITIVLITGTLVIRYQLNFIKNKDMGFEKEQIVVLHFSIRNDYDYLKNNIETVKTELLKHSGIVSAAVSKCLPNNIFVGRPRLSGHEPDVIVRARANWIDYDFIDLYGIEITEGRNFSREFPSDRESAVLLNEKAVKECKLEFPVGKNITINNRQTGKIIGIMKDFHSQSLHRPIEPLIFYYEPRSLEYISIKISAAQIPATLSYIEQTIKKFAPNYPFEYQFFDEMFNRAYKTEQKLGKLFGAFAFLSIVIACLGLFGLVMFTAGQRTKEVGIRKVLGAGVLNIIWILSGEFTKWLLVANFIAFPIAYYSMSKWLQSFAYRINISLGIFILSTSLTLFIAIITISYQSIKAATANPVDSLRYE